MSTAFERAGDHIGDAGEQMKQGCKDNANKAGDWMSEKYKNTKEGAADRMEDAGQYIKETARDAKGEEKTAGDHLADAGIAVKDAVVSGYEKTKEAVGGLFSSDEKK